MSEAKGKRQISAGADQSSAEGRRRIKKAARNRAAATRTLDSTHLDLGSGVISKPLSVSLAKRSGQRAAALGFGVQVKFSGNFGRLVLEIESRHAFGDVRRE